MSKLPNFIIIGAGKCGTTSLFHYLFQHPEIYMCPKKETFFFLGEESRLKNKQWGAVANLDEYKSLFKDAPENAVIGEISTTYYSSPNTAQLIHEVVPDTKIIAILRDPANRAFSDYLMNYKYSFKKNNFENLVDVKKYYVRLGFYYSQLINYFEVFDQKNIKVLIYEDLLNHPQAFLEDLFTFLEVQSDIKIDVTKKFRDYGVPKNKILYKLFIESGKARNITRRILETLPNKLSTTVYKKISNASMYKPTLSATDRAKLIEIYRPEIIKLQDLIHKDLSKWLTL